MELLTNPSHFVPRALCAGARWYPGTEQLLLHLPGLLAGVWYLWSLAENLLPSFLEVQNPCGAALRSCCDLSWHPLLCFLGHIAASRARTILLPGWIRSAPICTGDWQGKHKAAIPLLKIFWLFFEKPEWSRTQTSVFCSLRGLDLFWKNLEKPGIEVGGNGSLGKPRDCAAQSLILIRTLCFCCTGRDYRDKKVKILLLFMALVSPLPFAASELTLRGFQRHRMENIPT